MDALAEIRALELEMAQRLDDARTDAEAAKVRAADEARRCVAEAHERGARQAEERRRTRLEAAVAQAEQTRRDGRADAAERRQVVRSRLRDLVDEMVEVVLATTGGNGS